MIPLFKLLASIFLLVSSLHAELAPETYLEMQSKAPEAVRIRVEEIRSTRDGFLGLSGKRNETVTATVISVTRSMSALEEGDRIIIRYSHGKQKGAGASPVPRLKKGATYPAWLSKNGNGYFKPAAGGFSFSLVDR